MAWTTPGTAVAGDVLTAAFWNAQVRDQMTEVAPIMNAWTTFTPTIAQGATNNIAKTVTYSKYVRVGKFVFWQFRLDVTGPGTANNSLTLSMPVNAATSSIVGFGNGTILDGSVATTYNGTWLNISNLIYFIGDWAGVNVWGTNPNVAIASGDTISGTIYYEIA